MTDTWRSLSSLQTLLADNTSGAISAQDLRDMLVSVYPTVRVKDADETVNNSNTLQDDDDLTFPIGANEMWAVDVVLRYSTGDTPRAKYAFSVPSGATGTHAGISQSTDMDTKSSPTIAVALRAGGVLAIIKAIIINGSTAGDVTLQWAQAVADESDTKVLKGSYLIGRRLA